MINATFIAISIGMLLGVAFGYVGSRLVVRILPSRSWVSGGAVLALAPAFFLAFVVGGNLGGAYSAAVFGTPAPGLAFGVAIVLGGVVVCGAVLGGLVGRLVVSHHHV